MDAGIYVIENRANGKLYIGSALSMRRRFSEHRRRLQRGAHCSSILQRAWNKHGEEAFEFGCLEIVDCDERLIEREQAWLDALKTWDRAKGYNRSATAGSPLGVRHTEESRARNRAAQKGRKLSPEHRAKIGLANIGRPYSAETRAKLSAWQLGSKLSDERRAKISLGGKGRKFSEEHKARIGAAHRGRTLSAEHKAKLRGRKRSAESIERMRLAQRGKVLSDEHKAKISLAGIGRRATAETKARLLLAAKKRARDATNGRFARRLG